jgi:hypothetical protein
MHAVARQNGPTAWHWLGMVGVLMVIVMMRML